MSPPLIYQRVCLCANLLWSDLARQLLLKCCQLFFQNTKVLCLRMVEDECRNRRFRFHHKPFG